MVGKGAGLSAVFQNIELPDPFAGQVSWGCCDRMGRMDTFKNETHFDVVLLPSQEEALAWRKAAADGAASGEVSADEVVAGSGSSAFGTRATTFASWVADAWGLFGDGRDLVDALRRDMLMRSVCEELGLFESIGRGADRVAVRCVRDGAGLASFEAAVLAACDGRPDFEASDPADGAGQAAGSGDWGEESLAPQELSVLRAVHAYRQQLTGLGLVETGDAAALLPVRLPNRPVRVLVQGCAPLSLQQRAFFAACPWMDVVEYPAAGGDGPVCAPAGVDVRFAFPSGRQAQPALLSDLISRALSQMDCDADVGAQAGGARVVVAAKSPVELFERMAPALCREGATVALRGSRAFSETDFGRVWLGLCRFLEAGGEKGVPATTPAYGDFPSVKVEAWDRCDIADFLLSPFSGASRKYAFAFDADARGDRVMTRGAVKAELAGRCPLFTPLAAVAENPAEHEALGVVEGHVRSMTNRSESWRAEQLSAVAALRRVCEAAVAVGLGPQACLDELARARVDVSRLVAPREVESSGCADVLVCDQRTAARMPARSCELAVITDLDSASYRASDSENAASSLLTKLGLPPIDDNLSRMRRNFFACEHLPRACLVLERPLNDASAEPAYPCVVLEEFVDCYRANPTDTDDIDNPYALPQSLQKGMFLRGEDALFGNCRCAAVDAMPLVEESIPWPRTGEVSDARRALVVLPRVLAGGEVLDRPCLSPSQIESYLECPYKWFAERRLRLDDIDEGFGPAQMGDFAHNALCSFYRHFSEDLGLAKVTLETLPAARELMADVLARHRAMQAGMRTSENRLIATNELERRAADELERKLMDYLDYEARLLPTFHPAYLEYGVAAGGAVDYAGCKLLGTADRIDIDDAGRCVIIDYKGSLSKAYALKARDEGRLGKVQALIYAQVVRRTLGLEPVGALYVCYGRRPFSTGAFDARVLEAAHLPNMEHKNCAWSGESFAQLLDETEEAIASGLERLLAGDIAPRPATSEACKWCPVSACSERRA